MTLQQASSKKPGSIPSFMVTQERFQPQGLTNLICETNSCSLLLILARDLNRHPRSIALNL